MRIGQARDQILALEVWRERSGRGENGATPMLRMYRRADSALRLGLSRDRIFAYGMVGRFLPAIRSAVSRDCSTQSFSAIPR